ncbi:DUF3575 domain-containing protein [Flavobacterium silvisoli]|uniref:DUF3575 domain-containing protein n=1 Tax=Flavobacterium silvisoli TaxID=2529433 RepID=A0A4Q9Z3H9_9FLAO|nr:DUF3575 domain-containing protein [Flavobacterium silvisoli]TBX68381.1 DUF3575 domain-containing protein [Flavobacterium silvisoli]
MKKLFSLVLLFSLLSQAQQNSVIAGKKNEFRADVLSAVVYSKASLSYERFFDGDFSTGFNINFSNSSKLNDDFDNGYRNNLPKFEFNPYVRYALSKSKSRYYFAELFGSYNGGDYKEIIRLEDENGIGYYTTQKTKYTDFALGGSLGYKMYFKDSIALEFLVGFGSNLTNKAKSPDVISRVGLNLGYRF